MTHDTNNDGLLPVQTLSLPENEHKQFPNANAISSLCVLRDSNPILSQKWSYTSSRSKESSGWTSVKFDDSGEITELDLGGLMKLRELNSSPFLSMKYLKSFSLAGTSLSVNEIKAVLEAIIEAKPPLRDLFLGGLGMTCKDFMEILPLIRELVYHSLERLDLRYNNIGPDGALGFYDTLFRVDENEIKNGGINHLRKLFMEGNRIGDDGTMALSKVLSSSKCQLAEIYLGDNNIAEKGAKLIANALSQNVTLKSLYLEGNFIGPVGGLAFIELLETKQNDTLKKLFVDNNDLGKEIAMRLARALNNGSMIGGLFDD